METIDTTITDLFLDDSFCFVDYTNQKGKTHTLKVYFDYEADIQIEPHTYEGGGGSDLDVSVSSKLLVMVYNENWDYAREIKPSIALRKALKYDIEYYIEENCQEELFENYEY